MTEGELRLECLRLAHREHDDKREVVERARVYVDFVIGRNDAEIIGVVRELASRLGNR